VWLGVPPIIANATNTAAVWPGSLGAVWGYRRELRDTAPRMYWLIVPSVLGAITGAVLLRVTPAALFDRLIPLLILFATLLFAVQERLQRLFDVTPEHQRKWFAGAMLLQFFVSVYGGYFGAGMGILMLAALGLIGLTDIHQMNGLKNVLAVGINGIAAVYFATSGAVIWRDALILTLGTITGALLGARLAKRLGRQFVRGFVVAVGVVMAVALLFKP
jgi:uncharacterized membrane protein YfcA